MRKFLSVLLAASSIAMAAPESEAAVAPASPASIFEALESASMVQDARVICVNRRTGRVVRWGPCKRRVTYRVYCRNRRTKAFLHWGSC